MRVPPRRSFLLAFALLVSARTAAAHDATPAVEHAVAAYNSGDLATAFALLSREAETGDSDAEVNLGYLYARGQGVRPDQGKALELYMRSAKQGNGEGMNAIGYKFEHGAGVAPNIKEAVWWYCAAVQHGNPRALNNLAVLYERGFGVVLDVEEARRLWRQASQRGSVNAMYNLGRSLVDDRSLSGSIPEGVRWLRMAAAQGVGPAQQILRRLGFDEAFPLPRDLGAMMAIQPKDLPPGHADACGDLIA